MTATAVLAHAGHGGTDPLLAVGGTLVVALALGWGLLQWWRSRP